MQQVNSIDDMDALRPSLSTIAADISSPGNSKKSQTSSRTKRVRLFLCNG